MPARCQEVDNTYTCVQQWWRDRDSHRCSKGVTGQGGSVSTLEWHKWAGQGSTKAMNREQWHGTHGHHSLSHFFVSYYRMVNSHCFHVFSFSSLFSNQALLIPRNCSSLSQQWVKPNHLFSVSLLRTVFGPLFYAKSPQQQSHLVLQALNILMAPQFNSSSSTSPLSFRFTCWTKCGCCGGR